MILRYRQSVSDDGKFITVTKKKSGEIYSEGKIQGNAFTIAAAFKFENSKCTIFGDYHQNIQEQPLKEETKIKGLYTENEYMNANRAKFFDTNNNCIGVIKRQRIDTKVLWAEKYVFDYRGKNYRAYYVAKPLKGLFYFIVDENNRTVIAIKQDTTAIDWCFGYDIMLEDDSFAELAVMFLAYADYHKYGGRWVEFGGIKVKSETTLVAQPKEVAEHWDADFINRVKKEK